MQAHCSKCGKDFVERVGMSPLESVMAIKLRNALGNYCPECQAELHTTKKGRWTLRFLTLKVVLISAGILLLIFAIFAVFILGLTFAL